MKEITVQQMEREIASWSILFKEAGHGPQELRFLTDRYYSDLKDEIELHLFSEVMREVRKTCRFFPKVSDVLSARDRVVQKRKPEVVDPAYRLCETTTEHDMTPEEKEAERERFGIIKRMAAGEISHKEATEQLERWAR